MTRTALPLTLQSVPIDGRTWTERTEAAQAAQRSAGLPEVAPEAVQPTHLGAELQFMALVAHEAMTAWRAGDATRALEQLARQRALLSEHLLAWAPDYAQPLVEEARATFQRAVGVLTAVTCLADVDLLNGQ